MLILRAALRDVAIARKQREPLPGRALRRPFHIEIGFFLGVLILDVRRRAIDPQCIHTEARQFRKVVGGPQQVRLPWALCVRDRAPPGYVAVLLNPAHEHRDLLLPINAWLERLLGAIDGQRSLGDIVQEYETRGGAHRALPFFQRLWQYDQIVFDASRTRAAL